MYEFPPLDSSNLSAATKPTATALARIGKRHGTTPCWSQTTRPWFTNDLCARHTAVWQWTLYSLKECQRSTFLMRYSRTNPFSSRQDSLQDVLRQAGTFSLPSRGWNGGGGDYVLTILGQVDWINDGRVSSDTCYWPPESGCEALSYQPNGRSQYMAAHRNSWRHTAFQGRYLYSYQSAWIGSEKRKGDRA